MHGLNEGHIKPYTDIEFQLAKYQTYIIMKSQDKSLQLIFEETIILQSTPVISRLLGAKIRERELSGSPVISRCREKATTREFRSTDPHSQAFTTRKQHVER